MNYKIEKLNKKEIAALTELKEVLKDDRPADEFFRAHIDAMTEGYEGRVYLKEEAELCEAKGVKIPEDKGVFLLGGEFYWNPTF